jgi:hypothetical protein
MPLRAARTTGAIAAAVATMAGVRGHRFVENRLAANAIAAAARTVNPATGSM